MITINQIPNGPDKGQWWYRVHLSREEDWSGCAQSIDEAWENAQRLYFELLSKMGKASLV